MQIKSYILVRVTEALHFVSGLRCQMGFLSVLLVHIVFSLGNSGKQASHFRTDLPPWHLSFGDSLAREQSYHFPSTELVRPAEGRLPAAGGEQAPLRCLCRCWVGAAAAISKRFLAFTDIATQIHWKCRSNSHFTWQDIIHSFIKWQKTIWPSAPESSSGDTVNMLTSI